jgi:hypothetical protein
VGVEAYFVAQSLSALSPASTPIFATGLDFSFEAGKSHARGCPALLAEERRLSRLTRWPGQYASSLRERCVKLEAASGRDGDDRVMLSDPVLLSYAGILRERVANDASSSGRRIYDLRGRGPDIGGARVSFCEAQRILDDYSEKNAARTGRENDTLCDTESPSRTKARHAAAAIIGDELERLSELRAAMHGQKRIASDEFTRLACQSDYLWWSFPDQGRLRAYRGEGLPQDIMNRLVPEAEWWSLRLEALMHRDK